jgi:hypothetical protein
VTSRTPDRLMLQLVTAVGSNRAVAWRWEVGGHGGRQERRLDGWASMGQKWLEMVLGQL